MKIINSEIAIPITKNPTSEYFEKSLTSQNIDFLRWAIVKVEKENFILNVSHKV